MIRSLAPAILVLALAARTAAADPVRTYAYISDVGVTSSGGADFTHYHCTFTVQVPREVIEDAPSGPSPALLHGATTAHDYRNGDQFDCPVLEHTWQVVTFQSAHRDRVYIILPAFGTSWWVIVGSAAILFAILWNITTKWRWRWEFARTDRKMARIEKKITRIRDQRLARAQVVETKHDDPPRE